MQDTMTYRLAKDLARILTPLSGQTKYTIMNSACGTCPFEARLFILGLTSVVCHILSCFRGNAHDRA